MDKFTFWLKRILASHWRVCALTVLVAQRKEEDTEVRVEGSIDPQGEKTEGIYK